MRLWLIVLCLLLATVTAQGATYYVDSTYSEGGNGSEATPWDDLSDITGLVAGDTVKLKYGSHWREKLTPGTSGTSDTVRITYEPYGASGGAPIIDGSELLTPGSGNHWTKSASGTNEYYWNATGLTEPQAVWLNDSPQTNGTLGTLADHGWDWGNNDTLGYNTVYFRDDTGDPDTSGVTVESGKQSYVIDCGSVRNYLTFTGLDIRRGNGTLMAFISGTGIKVLNCTVQDIVTAGINLGNSSNGYLDSNVIRNSVKASANGVSVSGTSSSTTIVHNDISNINTGSTGQGIDIEGTTSGTLINKNEVYNCWRGILVTGAADGTTVRNNLLHSSAGSGVGVFLNSTAGTSKVYGNLIVDCHDAIYASATDGAGSLIYNNTIYNEANANYDGIRVAGTHASMQIKNNVVWANNTGTAYALSVAATGPVLNYNRYHNSGSGNLTYWVATAYSQANFANYQTASGQDAQSSVGDPSFVDRPNNKLQLSGGSACVNAGTNLGSPYDNALSPVSGYSDWWTTATVVDQDNYGSGWEIGTYVYDPAATSLPVILHQLED